MRRLRFPSVVALGIIPTAGGASVTLHSQAKNPAGQKPDAALRQKVAKGARGGRERVIAVSAWTGAGVRMAVIDSGIEPSADFAGRITGFYDFTRGSVPAVPFDDYGHGTHVAGLIGGCHRTGRAPSRAAHRRE